MTKTTPQQERENLKTALVEALADIEHQRWADWQKYLHSLCFKLEEYRGALIIPADLVERWERQIATPYADLSESEKQSDRDQVERYLGVVAEYVASRLAQRDAEILKRIQELPWSPSVVHPEWRDEVISLLTPSE